MIDGNYWGSRLKWVLTCLVFYALPFLLVSYGLDARWDIQERESLEASYVALDTILLEFRKRDETDVYISKLIMEMCRLSRRVHQPVPLLKKGIASLHSRFPNVLRFTVTDGSGNVVPELSDGKPPKLVVKRLFETLTSSSEAKVVQNRFSRLLGMFKSFIGNEINLDAVHGFSREFTKASFYETDRYFMYDLRRQEFGVMVHATEVPSWSTLCIRDQCRQFNKFRSHFEIETGVQDIAENDKITGDLAVVMGFFQRTNRQHFPFKDRLYSVMPFLTTGRIWASRARSCALDRSGIRLSFNLAGILIFAVLTIFSYSVMVGGREFPISIRLRLIVLFGFASGLPLAVVIMAGWDYLNQKYDARVRQAHDEMERSLLAFDSRFPQMRGKMEVTLARELKMCHFDTLREKRHTGKILNRLLERYLSTEIILFNGQGTVAWDSNSIINWKGQRARKMMGGIIANILANLNREVFSGKMDAAVMFLESFTGAESPVSQLTRNLGRIIDFSMAGASTWTFINPVVSATGRFTHMVMGNWNKQKLESLYLLRELVTAQNGTPGVRFASYSDKSREWFPAKFPLKNRLRRFMRDLMLREATTIGRLNSKGVRFLVTGIKPKELANQSLVAFQSDAPIRDEIALMEQRLQLFTFLSAAISVFLGFILSQRFLTPIMHLSAGVVAIQKRDFKHRVPPGEPDELGDLALTFNRVMEGLSDLEVGRIVQDSLFPSQEVKVGPFRVFGSTSSASELGGDYFDVQTLPDGRVLVLIGDVSGHGVPAALVMAMAKALVERECEIDPTPDILLANVHRVFYRTLKRKRMMTCFLGLLDPVTCIFSFANAGHNFPFLFPANAPPTALENTALPLGSLKKNPFKLDQLILSIHDRILFYTDGLVEAHTLDGSAIGYQRMTDEIGPLLEDDPQQSCNSSFSWHRGLTGGGQQEDDITVVIVSFTPRSSIPAHT